MEYWAHKSEDGRVQMVEEHLEGTARRAGQFADAFGKHEWGYCCGLMHDIGKYSQAFQRKIRNDGTERVDHSSAGAQLCYEKKGRYPIMSYCIAGHHAGLPDFGSSSDAASAPTLMGRLKKKVEDYQAYRTEIQIPELDTDPFDIRQSKNPDFSLSMFIRMLFSCLTDADFLDTESFMNKEGVERDSGAPLDSLLEKLESYTVDWQKNQNIDTINGRRSEILRYCFTCGDKERGLFKLTVPTGGGKTIASLAFALRHAVKHKMNRIIYVIPYISIIEQNAEVFRKILGERNVLENHYNVDYNSSEEWKPMQLAAENWDKPVVVTTNVQLFESLFANKTSKCRKLHNITNSVIIFDEAQMLPNDYLKPCLAAMEELVRRYRSSIVLCTATQPALDMFWKELGHAAELCPRRDEQFRFFRRSVFCSLGTLDEQKLSECLGREHQALCILNTRKAAQKLYEIIEGEGVYHLSTTMCPKHRMAVLDQIRDRLRENRRCILISTSLVEAGVDLDFSSVYRQLAGMDSMIQAAGRCNREGKKEAEQSKVYIFDLKEQKDALGQRQQIDISRSLLTENRDISSLDTIEEYFRELYYVRGEGLDKKQILKKFEKRSYNFASAAENFKLIENSEKTVFVPFDEGARELLRQIELQGFSKDRMRQAGKYCIGIFETEWNTLYGLGKIQQISEDIPNLYKLTDAEVYAEDRGLNLMLESGEAIWM